MRIARIASLLFGVAAALRAETGGLGRIDFPVSASGPAMEHFQRGALLLHSFEYDDAAEEFRAAREAAPGFAMAYWGEAMTKNHPLWSERDAEGARALLAKLGPTREKRLARAPTAREKAWLGAVETLFEEGEKHDRDLAYAEAMRRLHEAYPDDLEAAAFYALSLLGTCADNRDTAVYMRAAAIAEEVFARNPMHPGAAHYLIHSYDDPVHAPLGLRAAKVYSKIAKDAAHALHMPSHIFLASGMWDDVVSSNEASFAAADARVARKKLGVDQRNYHARYWLEYAYLQQGRFRDARRLLREMEEDEKRSGSVRARSSSSAMRAAYLVETSCGSDAPPPSGTDPRDVFAAGFCAWKKGDAAGIAAAIAALAKPAPGSDAPGHAHTGGGADSDDRSALSAVFRMELEAVSLLGEGRGGDAVARAREAAAAEEAMSFEFGPPIVVKPARELAGEILLLQNLPAESQQEFEASLKRTPGRSLSLAGLASAASKSEDRTAALESRRRLEDNYRRADPAAPGYVPLAEHEAAAAGPR